MKVGNSLQKNSPVSFWDLPENLLIRLIQMLDLRSLMAFRLVSTDSKKLADDRRIFWVLVPTSIAKNEKADLKNFFIRRYLRSVRGVTDTIGLMRKRYFLGDFPYKGAKEIGLAQVRKDGMVLTWLPPFLKGDREVVLAALRQNQFALSFSSVELQKDWEVIIQSIVRKSGRSFTFPELQEEFIVDFKSFGLEITKKNPLFNSLV